MIIKIKTKPKLIPEICKPYSPIKNIQRAKNSLKVEKIQRLTKDRTIKNHPLLANQKKKSKSHHKKQTTRNNWQTPKPHSEIPDLTTKRWLKCKPGPINSTSVIYKTKKITLSHLISTSIDNLQELPDLIQFISSRSV